MAGIELQLHSFFTLTLDGGEWPTSHPDNFTPGMNPGTHSVGGFGGGGAQWRSERIGEDKNPLLLPGFEPQFVQPVA
jgi:hypothetical protein